MIDTKAKMIRTDPTDWAIYNNVATALSKQVGFKMYVNNTVKIAMREYIDNHPELKVKA